VDQDNKPTGDEQLRGRVWIGDFIFTHCAGACPLVTAKFVELQKSLEDPDIRFVSFSVDPERDDPKTLKDYGKKNNPDDRWMLLRPPDRAAVFNVAQRMAAIAKSTDSHDEILHTDFFILIDPAGKVRGLYDSKKDSDVERLKHDARALIRQRAAEQAKENLPGKSANAG
jgi:protein SCO1/2